MSRTSRGFTLVEVMVSLAIMAIVATVAFSGLSIGLSGWERGSKVIDRLDRRETVERLIRQQLGVASPIRVAIGKDGSIMFRGSSQRLEFMSDYSLSDGPGDFRKIDYAFTDGHFLYGEKPLFGYEALEKEDPPTQQLASFDQVSFKFLAADPHGNPIWLNEWDLGLGIPAVMQVRLDDDTFIIRMVNR